MVDSSALAAASGALPAWAPVGPLLWWVPGAFAASWVATRLAAALALRPLRRFDGGSWVERARLAYPGRVAATLVAISGATALAAIAWRHTGPLSQIPDPLLAGCVFAAGHLGGFAARRPVYAEIRGRVPGWRRGLSEEVYALLLMLPHVGLLLLLLACVGPAFDLAAGAALAAGAVAFGGIAHFGGLPIVRALGGAWPAPPRVVRVVAETAARVGVSPASSWIVRVPMANAFAFPLSRRLAFTEDAVEALDDAQLAAITAHELGHLSEPLPVRIGRAAGVFALFPLAFWTPVVARVGFAGGAGLVLVCWAVLVGVRSLARRMESRADAIGAEHAVDSETYARAVERLYRANGAPAVGTARRPIHPHLYDRLLVAGVEPDYPRPAPPSRARVHGGVALGTTALIFAACALFMLPWSVARWADDPRQGLGRSVALSGGSAEDLFSLALLADDPRDAIALLKASAAVDPSLHYPAGYLAQLLGDTGQCQEAEVQLNEAEFRLHPRRRAADPWLSDARLALRDCWARTAGADT